MTTTAVQRCDVLIVGGGLVGATLAACLARIGCWRVVVVEKMSLPEQQDLAMHPSYDARNTALANGTCHVFDQLGIWSTLRTLAEPILQVNVSDQGGIGRTTINARDEAVRALGYVIENRLLGQVLLAHLGSLSGLTWRAPATASRVTMRQAGVDVELDLPGNQTERWQAALLVVADGAESATCRQLGIGVTRRDYGQTGIVTTVTPVNGHQQIAWERFSPEGPLALLPQTQQRLGVTWCLSHAQAQRMMALDEPDFLAALQQAAGAELGELRGLGARYAYPLSLTLSKEQIRSRIVVLGNAAHALHPVAGQGFNMAVRDVATLTRVLAGDDASGPPTDPGRLEVLQQYWAERAQDQRNTIAFSDQVTRLFSSRSSPRRWARNAGLMLFELLPGAKRLLARHAMGRASSTRLPLKAGTLSSVAEPAQKAGQA